MSRTESPFSHVRADGMRMQLRVLSAITIDDLMGMAMRAATVEVLGVAPYASPFPRELKDHMVKTRVTTSS